MWFIACFNPVTLFSLRPANATSSGGKTLLCPTPFAVKMALLNAAITLYGADQAEAWFEDCLRDLQVAICLPDALLVVSTFQRIRRPKAGDGYNSGLIGSWGPNIAFREYVCYPNDAPLQIAIQTPDNTLDVDWALLFSQIAYLGKRGSFFQYHGCDACETLTDEFTWLNPPEANGIALHGTLQLMDDCGPEMTFAHANIYDPKRLYLNRQDGRLLNTIALPYEIAYSARGFTRYQRWIDVNS